MRIGTTLVLLAAVLALGAYIVLVERKSETTEKREELARFALKVDAARVTRFSLVSDALQITCEKEGRQWKLTSPVNTRADGGAVERLLEELQRLPKGEVITAEQQKKAGLTAADYGFDRPRIRLVLGSQDGEQAILIGRDAQLGGTLYMKEEGRDEIVSTSTNILAVVPHSVTDIRDRRLFAGAPADAARVAIKRTDGFIELVKNAQGTWRIVKPLSARADDAKVQALLNHLFEGRVADFVAESVAGAPLYGLDEPAVQVTISSGKNEQALLLGRGVERAPDQVYATFQGAESVFSVSTGFVAGLHFGVDLLRDRRLVTLPAYEITYIEMQEGERTLKLMQSNGVWNVTEPKQFKADDEHVQMVLSEWAGAKIGAYNDEPVSNRADLGLSPPAKRILFARSVPPPPSTNAAAAAPSPDVANILVSTVDAGHDRFMVHVEGEDSLYLVDSAPVHAITVDPLKFRDHQVLAVDPAGVRSISVQRGGLEYAVERESTNLFHTTTGGVARVVDAGAVQGVLDAVRSIRATDLIAEDPADLAPFGLQAPDAVLTLGLSAEAGLGKAVLLGAAAGEGYVYGMIKGQDVVFTLEKAVADKLTAALYKDKETAAPEVPTVETGKQSAATAP